MNLGGQLIIVEGNDLVEDCSMPQEVAMLRFLGLARRIILEYSDHVEYQVVSSEALDQTVLIVIDHHANDFEQDMQGMPILKEKRHFQRSSVRSGKQKNNADLGKDSHENETHGLTAILRCQNNSGLRLNEKYDKLNFMDFLFH